MRRARSKSDGIEELVAQIRRYVSAHPSAADSLNGILGSWLNTRMASVETVQAALDQLIVEGYLSRHKVADGSTIYRRVA